MAKLRGSKKIREQALVGILTLLLDFDDIEQLKAGLRGLIKYLNEGQSNNSNK